VKDTGNPRQEGEDGVLVAEALDGSQEAFRRLYDRYQAKIRSLILSLVGRPEEADDIVQQVFIRAFRSLSGFGGRSSFYTWLYRVALNTTTDFRRKKVRLRKRESLELDDDNPDRPALQVPAPAEEGPEESLYRKELAGIIGQAMQSLSEEHRQVLVLREMQGLNYQEIADTVGIELGTVMSRLFYARRRLAEILQRSGALD